MKKLRYFLLIAASVLLLASPVMAAETPQSDRCKSSLESARVASQKAHQGEHGLQLYEAAFQLCDQLNRHLEPEFWVKVMGEKAKVAHLYQNDRDRAITLYEKALIDAEAKLDPDTPVRIGLLYGLASALASRARMEEGPAAKRDRANAIQALQESLAVRRAAYGENSAEAVRGLISLGYGFLPAHLYLAEEYVSEALVIVEAKELPPEVAAETYSALGAVYEQLGRKAEATAASERAGELFEKAFPSGMQP